ncbi:hypothetical protein D3C81_350360 [compost metagenome]
MSIALSRYNYIRERLITLFNVINNRTFPVYITPLMMMSLDEMRDRPEYHQDGFVNDNEFYSTHQVRKLKCPAIIDILPNLSSEKDLSFQNANEVIPQIYESIQEYISLWCELRVNAPEFTTPSTEELRKLELLAYSLFGRYKKIKPYLDKMKHKQVAADNADAEKRNILSLMALFGMKAIGTNNDELSFVSHLDELEGGDVTALSFENQPMITAKAVADSLTNIETPQTIQDLGDWIFKGTN